MDYHADTHVFGRHFRVYFTTSKKCTLSPFLPEYSEQLDAPIATGAMTVDLKNGSMMILIFGQGLWFRDKMDKSLRWYRALQFIGPHSSHSCFLLIFNRSNKRTSSVDLLGNCEGL